MNLLDVFVCLFILYFSWRGFKNGLAKEIFRITGLVLAGFFSFQYASILSQFVPPQWGLPTELLPFLCFGLLFILSLFLVQLGITFLDRLIELLLLSTPNRLLGSLFGIIKSSIYVSIVLIFFSGFGWPGKELKAKSFFYHPLIMVAPASYDLVARVLPGVKPYRDSVEYYLSLPAESDINE